MAAFEEPIATERMLLRHFRATDLDDVQTFQSDPDVVRFLYWTVRTPEQSREWLEERIAACRLDVDDDGVALAAERREDGRVIGSVNVWLRSREHHQGEVGFVFARDVQRQGYAREAMTGLLDTVFP